MTPCEIEEKLKSGKKLVEEGNNLLKAGEIIFKIETDPSSKKETQEVLQSIRRLIELMETANTCLETNDIEGFHKAQQDGARMAAVTIPRVKELIHTRSSKYHSPAPAPAAQDDPELNELRDEAWRLLALNSWDDVLRIAKEGPQDTAADRKLAYQMALMCAGELHARQRLGRIPPAA